jgi:hypothetical protein
VASLTVTYACPACHVTSAATVTELSDPLTHIAPGTRATLRMTRAVLVQAGRGKEGDPVDEVAGEILEQEARRELRYATCPRCGARSPEGVAELRRSTRWSTWTTVALLSAFAVVAWFGHWVAAILPGLNLVARPLAVARARRAGEPVRWLLLAPLLAFDAALVAIALLVPRAAPLVPLVPLAVMLVRKPEANERPWQEAAKKIRFAGEAPREEEG